MTDISIGALAFGALAGIAATVTMDVLGAAARRVGLCAGAKGQWVGRWYLGIARSRFAHPDIEAVPAQAGEQRSALRLHLGVPDAVSGTAPRSRQSGRRACTL